MLNHRSIQHKAVGSNCSEQRKSPSYLKFVAHLSISLEGCSRTPVLHKGIDFILYLKSKKSKCLQKRTSSHSHHTHTSKSGHMLIKIIPRELGSGPGTGYETLGGSLGGNFSTNIDASFNG